MADWDRAISYGDKSKWRDPRVAVAYVKLALADGNRGRYPHSGRFPQGALRDVAGEEILGREGHPRADALRAGNPR